MRSTGLHPAGLMERKHEPPRLRCGAGSDAAGRSCSHLCPWQVMEDMGQLQGHHSSVWARSQGLKTLLETAPEPCWDGPSLGRVHKGPAAPAAPGSQPTFQHPWHVWCLSLLPSCTTAPPCPLSCFSCTSPRSSEATRKGQSDVTPPGEPWHPCGAGPRESACPRHRDGSGTLSVQSRGWQSFE